MNLSLLVVDQYKYNYDLNKVEALSYGQILNDLNCCQSNIYI